MRRVVLLSFPRRWTLESVSDLRKVATGAPSLRSDSSAFLGWRTGDSEDIDVDPSFGVRALGNGWVLRDLIVLVRERPRVVQGRLPRYYDFLYWFVRDPDTYYFDLDAVRVKNITGDKRNHPKGKNPGNVWRPRASQTRLDGGSRRRIRDWWVDPAYVERAIKATTARGDLVLDPLKSLPGVQQLCKDLGRAYGEA